MEIKHDVDFLGGTPVRVIATNCGVVEVNVRFYLDRNDDGEDEEKKRLALEEISG